MDDRENCLDGTEANRKKKKKANGMSLADIGLSGMM